jgi:membrane-bound metal-dependent hydrolase YbcI (DUF457 family)
MFIGHFGAGFSAKAALRCVSLGTLFLAAQFIDLLWPTLLLLGVEQVRIVPGATAVTPLIFEDYPISHSLLAVLAWSITLGVVYFRVQRNWKFALGLAALVLSHWLLDVLVHQPDLQLYPGASARLGLGLWSSVTATLAVEVPLFAVGIWLYTETTAPADRAGKWGLWALVAFLLAIYAGNLFGPPPPSVKAIGWVGQMQWLLVIWAYWLDRHRVDRRPSEARHLKT